jgi:anaerobic magnesium-protoporphyrin IX monomethyl ester cyclase
MEKEKMIDCLLIGHNEMDFVEYEKSIRNMGMNSGAYKDLDMNFIIYNRRPTTLPELYNIIHNQKEESGGTGASYFHVAESFSAAVAYLGTYLDRNGCTFDYVKDFRYSRARLAEKLRKGNILVTAIITTLYVSMLPIIEIIEFIRKYNPTTRIILGGPFVSTKARTTDPEELEYIFQTNIGADFYVNSTRGEATLIKIIKAIKNNLPLGEIPNIYYKVGESLETTPVVKEDQELSRNMVNWDLFKESVHQYANARTAISCPFACAFCGYPQHAGQYQTAPVEAIERELETLDKIGTVKSVHFIDDTFNFPPGRFKEILRMIINNKFSFKWHSYFRCQYADREMVQLMKMSGCEGVFLGLESGSDRILKNMNKAVTVEKYLRGLELLKEYGIVTFGNFIIGFPGETEETIKETVKFIETGGLDFYRAQLWYCEPITPIFKQKDHYRIQGESFQWRHATMDSPRAGEIIENIFLTIEKPTWIPQYNFDFDGIWHLVHRGMSIPQLTDFLKGFNRAVREKLTGTTRGEISAGTLKQIKNAAKRGPGSPSNREAARE